MKRGFRRAAWAVVFGFLVSCGGGSGIDLEVGEVAPVDEAAEAVLKTYAGDYLSVCEEVPGGINMETGAPLYAWMESRLVAVRGATIPMSGRIEFFENASCSGSPLGLLVFEERGSNVSLAGTVTLQNRVAHKVILQFGVRAENLAPGPTPDTAVFGTAIRLQVPRLLTQAFEIRDLWYLNGDALFEGASTLDKEGFPTALEAVPTQTKLKDSRPFPAGPCGAQTVTWSSSWATCQAHVRPQVSNTIVTLHSESPAGKADLTCWNGNWNVPYNASCGAPSPTPVPACPAQTVTWTVGTETCSASVPYTESPDGHGMVSVLNVTAGLTGRSLQVCQRDGTWKISGVPECGVTPPPPPQITDPLALAQVKNCLLCHAVRGPGFGSGSFSLPSFERIANFYRANPPAPGVLEAKVKAGSVGVFGTAPMPPNPQVSDADLAILIPWILSQPN